MGTYNLLLIPLNQLWWQTPTMCPMGASQCYEKKFSQFLSQVSVEIYQKLQKVITSSGVFYQVPMMYSQHHNGYEALFAIMKWKSLFLKDIPHTLGPIWTHDQNAFPYIKTLELQIIHGKHQNIMPTKIEKHQLQPYNRPRLTINTPIWQQYTSTGSWNKPRTAHFLLPSKHGL